MKYLLGFFIFAFALLSSKDLADSEADAQLNQRIHQKVSEGLFQNNYSDISLNTKDGVVTLEGYVKKNGDQEKLLQEIQKVDGVKTVRSRVIFRNPP